jgi:hypothetical protein
MGIADETRVRLTCAKCGATDVVHALQKGSGYGLGAWSDFSDSSAFDFDSKNGADGPNMTAATCKRCKVPALIG